MVCRDPGASPPYRARANKRAQLAIFHVCSKDYRGSSVRDGSCRFRRRPESIMLFAHPDSLPAYRPSSTPHQRTWPAFQPLEEWTQGPDDNSLALPGSIVVVFWPSLPLSESRPLASSASPRGSRSGAGLIHKPPEPHAECKPDSSKHRDDRRPPRTHKRQWDSHYRHQSHDHTQIAEDME